MVQKYILALTVLGAFFIVAAGSAQAGWGHSYDSTLPGESMSSEPATPEGTWGTSEQQTQGMESSDYQKEEAVETGRLPESQGFESNMIIGDDVVRKLNEGIIPGGP
jgi:hypothetical protein